jgi:glycosyltransferase involved in cell wall biosynthesis
VRILIDYRPALRERTGVGEYVHGMATALAGVLPAGDSLVLFSSSWKDRLSPDAVPGTGSIDARIPVRLLNLAWHRWERPPVEWLAGPVDVVHSMHPLMLPSRGGVRVVTVHDLYFLDRPEGTTAEIQRDYPKLAQSHAIRADLVVVPSKYTGRLVETRFGVDQERLVVCSPGAPSWPRREEPRPGGPILFVGTIEPRKNVPQLIEAYDELAIRLPDVPPLVVAGRVPPGVTPPFGTLPAAGRLQFTGYVTDAERLRLYREASMLVVPSLDEGFGLPALEAMTLGVPVVAARRGALPEVVGEAGILVDPDDRKALSAAMERVLTDAATRCRLADAGVRRSAAFTWTSSATRLYEGYSAARTRRGLT